MGFLNNFTGGAEHKGGLKKKFEAIKPKLNLSADQEQKINEIFKNFREERSEIKDSGGDSLKEELSDARHNTKEQIMGVLNDDQKKTMQQHLREQRRQAD